MDFTDYELEYVKKIQALGNNNVFIAGSFILSLIGIKRTAGDIDIIVVDPNKEQAELVNAYRKIRVDNLINGGDAEYHLDFLKEHRKTELVDNNLVYKGIPVAKLSGFIQFKKKRGTEEDYKDINKLMRLVLESTNLDINKEEVLLSILTVEPE